MAPTGVAALLPETALAAAETDVIPAGRFERDLATASCAGVGVRLGGDTPTDGVRNDVYRNSVHDNALGGIKVMRTPQGKVCGNTFAGNGGANQVGSYAGDVNPTSSCLP